jgi:HD-GYP domain-containing protein (c-di-GMP phosphodiesterase class II)
MGKPAAGENPQGVRVHELGPEELRKLYSRFIKDIFNASMKAEPDTASHAERVMRFSIRVARRMGLSGKSIENLKAAALLHDLGKLAVDQKVLFKKGRLTAEEYEKIKKHPFWAAEVVKMIYFLHDIVPIMGSHHESFDGEGYPECMKGRDIPIESRILSIADVFEALIADRPYRKGYPREKAIELIEMEKGRKFDPEVTDVFLEMLREGEIE